MVDNTPKKLVTPEKTEKMGALLPQSLMHNPNQNPARYRKADISSPTTNAANLGLFPASAGSPGNVSRVPSRRFYDPTIMTSAIYIPVDFVAKNKWRRWFYTHDPIVGSVLDMHSDAPFGDFSIECEDPAIKRHFEDMVFNEWKLPNLLPKVTLEYMKIGEVSLYDNWDPKKGMFTATIIHNPDFISVQRSIFADEEDIIEMVPSIELKQIASGTDPKSLKAKQRIPKDLLQRIIYGKNIPLDAFNTTRIVRRANPSDQRGTAIIDRIFKLLMYEDKLLEAQLTIADNFVYPLKIFKLGDPATEWVPDESHMQALQDLLVQQHMDPNFSIIFHYGLTYEQHNSSNNVMRLDGEWARIDDIKFYALGMDKQLIQGTTTWGGTNPALQLLMQRHLALRNLVTNEWVYKKFRQASEKNKFFSKEKLDGKPQAIVPKLVYHKRLGIREDQSYLGFVQQLFSQGKGSVSSTTMLSLAGLNIETELANKKNEATLEAQYKVPLTEGNAGGPAPIAFVKDLRKKIAKLFKKGKEIPAEDKEDLKKSILDLQKEYADSIQGLMNEYPEVFSDLGISANLFVGTDKQPTMVQMIDEHLPTVKTPKFKVLKSYYTHITKDQFKNRLETLGISKPLINQIELLEDKLHKAVNLVSLKDDIVEVFSNIFFEGKNKFNTEYLNQPSLFKDTDIDITNTIILEDAEHHFLTVCHEYLELDNVATITQEVLPYVCYILRSYLYHAYTIGILKGYEYKGISGVVLVPIRSVLENNDIAIKYKPINEILSMDFEESIDFFKGLWFYQFLPEYSLSNENTAIAYIGNLKVHGIPLEYQKDVNELFKCYKSRFKDKYKEIVFVDRIVEVKEYQKQLLDGLRKKYETENSQQPMEAILAQLLVGELTNRAGITKYWEDTVNKTLYFDIINLKKATSFIKSLASLLYDLLIKNFVESQKKFDSIMKTFKETNWNLDKDAIKVLLETNSLKIVQNTYVSNGCALKVPLKNGLLNKLFEFSHKYGVEITWTTDGVLMSYIFGKDIQFYLVELLMYSIYNEDLDILGLRELIVKLFS